MPKTQKKNSTPKQKRHVKTAIREGTVRLQQAMSTQLANVDRGAAAVAASICCPGPFPARRFQDGYDALPTALFSPQTIEEAPFSTTPEPSGTLDSFGIPLTEQWGFAFRDPRRALVLLDHNGKAGTVGATWSYLLIGSEVPYSYAANNQWETYVEAFSQSPYKPHGDVIRLGSGLGDDDGGYFPMSGFDDLVIQGYVGASGTCPFSLCIMQVDGSVSIRQGNALLDGGAGTATIRVGTVNPPLDQVDSTRWFGYVKLRTIAAAFTNPVVRAVGNHAVWRHYGLGDYEDVAGLIEVFRANGMLLMFSNTANELYKNGDVAGWQAPKSSSYHALALRGYGHLVRAPGGSGNFMAKTGLMGFYKPSAPSDMSFVAVSADYEGEDKVDFFPVQPASDFLAICVSIPNEGGRAGRWTLSVNAEGRTDSPWFAHILDDTSSRPVCEAALDLVRTIPQWHENPLHIADIGKALQKGVEWMRNHEAPLAETFENLAQAFPMLQRFVPVFKSAQKLLK